PSHPLHSPRLEAPRAAAFISLSRMNLENMHLFRMSRADRNTALDLLIQYYSTHFGAIRSLQSLPVVRAIFD
ncbi:MAG: DNA repair protein RecO, partial [Muribaculaceae bacterium]|nr:DNA repair protein RecO [Muribaculaceae bacterium]